MKNPFTGFTFRDSPIMICLLTILLGCLTYLVYMHPQHFEGFFYFVLFCGFITLGGLLVAYYPPFTRYYNALINQKCRQTSYKPHLDYHDQLKAQTNREVDLLIKSKKYQEFERRMKENGDKPVVMCENKTIEDIEEEAKELEDLETQIFRDDKKDLGYERVVV